MSLERLSCSRGRLRPAEVIPLGAAIARGLAAAHAPRHRAPRRQAGQRAARPRRLDQGDRLRHRRPDRRLRSAPRAWSSAPPATCRPRALRGAGHNRAGDLFALGVVLYECLAGVKPFGGGIDVSDIVQATLFGAIRPLGPRVEEPLPRELESIVLQLLERDNFLRPANAAAVADELDHLAASLGLRWRLEERAGPARRRGVPRVHHRGAVGGDGAVGDGEAEGGSGRVGGPRPTLRPSAARSPAG